MMMKIVLDKTLSRADRSVRLFTECLVVGLALCSASVASAQNLEPVQVYATATNVDTGPNGPVGILDVPGEEQRVFLWASGGTEASTGTPCTEAGSGSALCGVAFTLDVTGGYEIVDFDANPSFDGSAVRLPFRITIPSPDKLVGNAFDLGEPNAENRYLGMLALRTNGVNGDSQIAVRGGAIGADLTMRTITSEAIVVPEPGVGMMLGLGAVSLLALRRRQQV